MAARILVVEDEAALAELLAYNLEAAGHEVRVARDGEEAALLLAEEDFDLALIDWMLPGLSGLELCRRLRRQERTRGLPVIMVTARGEEEDRVRGLETGADDYLTKPLSMAELRARVGALLRRARPGLAGDVVQFADIVLDRRRRRAERAGRALRLSPLEFRLLDCFLGRPGRVLSREQLLDLVWGPEAEVGPRTVDVHVGRLRQALNRRGERDPIRTVRGVGYALDETYGPALRGTGS